MNYVQRELLIGLFKRIIYFNVCSTNFRW